MLQIKNNLRKPDGVVCSILVTTTGGEDHGYCSTIKYKNEEFLIVAVSYTYHP